MELNILDNVTERLSSSEPIVPSRVLTLLRQFLDLPEQ